MGILFPFLWRCFHDFRGIHVMFLCGVRVRPSPAVALLSCRFLPSGLATSRLLPSKQPSFVLQTTVFCTATSHLLPCKQSSLALHQPHLCHDCERLVPSVAIFLPRTNTHFLSVNGPVPMAVCLAGTRLVSVRPVHRAIWTTRPQTFSGGRKRP